MNGRGGILSENPLAVPNEGLNTLPIIGYKRRAGTPLVRATAPRVQKHCKGLIALAVLAFWPLNEMG